MSGEKMTEPFSLFHAWYAEACSRQEKEVDSMVLATTSPAGRPSARIVLYKGLEAEGLVFYSNYESKKGMELLKNPQASLLFYWPTLAQQVRIEGAVEELPGELSDRYWKSRPRDSQMSGFASQQSRVIPSFESLTDAVQGLRERFRDKEIPRPKNWGGYRVVPDYFEFWQGDSNRLHRRTRYRKSDQKWIKELLSP